MKVAFCARDGTVTVEHSDDVLPYIESPTLRHGSIEGLKLLSQKGYELFIITNQPLIGEGKITMGQYYGYSKELVEILELSGVRMRDIFMCPHTERDRCDCRKPQPGLINQTLFRYPFINLTNSIVIGDRVSDMQLADSFGLKGFSIGFNHPSALRVETILEAAQLLE